MTTTDSGAPAHLAGRDTAPLTGLTLAALGLLAGAAGFVAFAGSPWSEHLFAWGFESPLSSALFGAAMLGAVPLMLHAATRGLWEEARIGLVPAAVLVPQLLLLTLVHRDQFAIGGGPIVALLFSVAWLLAMLGLTAALALALVAQLREPGLPLERTAPVPRWAVPLIGVLGSAYLGLGLGLILSPGFWGGLLPWEVDALDARALGIWALTLGVALLQALAEDDLERVRSGLYGVVAIGALALAALAWWRGEVDWSGPVPVLVVLLLAALPVTGMIGLRLRKRALRVA